MWQESMIAWTSEAICDAEDLVEDFSGLRWLIKIFWMEEEKVNSNLLEEKWVKFDEDWRWRVTYLHMDGMLVILHVEKLSGVCVYVVVVVCNA